MQGYSNLYTKLLGHIKGELRHQDYKYVCELSKLYKQLSTGEDIEDLIKQFNKREDDEQFKQRKELTTLITECIAAKISAPQKKIATAQTIQKEAYLKTDDPTNKNDNKQKALEDALNKFYNGKGIDAYLEDVLIDLNDIDPNAFILFLFNNYDNRIESPVVYGIPIYCDEALNFEYVNNELDWLIFRKSVVYKDGENDKSGYYYSIIAADEQISFSPVSEKSMSGMGMSENTLYDESGNIASIENLTEGKYFIKLSGKYYMVILAAPKAGFTPAFRVGAVKDPRTNGRTMVNLWDKAVPYLKKSVKTCSELDITESLHVFAQTFEYQPRCTGQILDGNVIPCNAGITPQGSPCKACNGTGYQANKSGQDKITIGLPRDPKDIFDLRNLKAYISAPIDILDKLVERLENHEKKAIETVYNSNRFVTTSFAKTATENQIDYQSVYDALRPLMSKYSSAWEFIVKVNAAYNDIKDITVKHKFGHRIGFESEDDIIRKIQAAKAAGVSSYVLEQMNNDLIYVIYADYPEIIKKIEVKQKFFPFEGKDPSTIAMMISQGYVEKSDIILYANFKRIFAELESENPNFFLFAEDKQRSLISAKVNKIQEDISKQSEIAIPFNDSTGA